MADPKTIVSGFVKIGTSNDGITMETSEGDLLFVEADKADTIQFGFSYGKISITAEDIDVKESPIEADDHANSCCNCRVGHFQKIMVHICPKTGLISKAIDIRIDGHNARFRRRARVCVARGDFKRQ